MNVNGLDISKIFSISGIKENTELKSNINRLISRITNRFFDDDFPSFFDSLDKELTKYSRYGYNKLLKELLNSKFTEPIHLSGLSRNSYYKNIKYVMEKYQELLNLLDLPAEVFDNSELAELDFKVIDELSRIYSDKKINEPNIKDFFLNLRYRCLYNIFERRDLKSIDDMINCFDPEEDRSVFICTSGKPIYVGKQPDRIEGIEIAGLCSTFWSLCLNLDGDYFDSLASGFLNNLNKLFIDIDSFKNKCKENPPRVFFSETIDDVFCDGIKACLLTKYADFEEGSSNIIKMIENDYDKVFENINGISFKQYLLNQGDTEWFDNKERNKEIIEYIDIKDNQEMRMEM